MKRLKRNPEKFDVLDLFCAMGVKHGYDLSDPASQADFLERVRSSFESSKVHDTTIYGKRTEALFAYVVGGLGKAKLLKQEDAGEVYYKGDDMSLPDYRLLLNDGNKMLIEVKNCNHTNLGNNLSIKKEYHNKIKRYADLQSLPLKFAIYLSAWNLWALLSIDYFDEHKGSYTIQLAKALACSEMAVLGDRIVATTPNLELHLLASQDEAEHLNNSGEAKFTARDLRIYCAGHEVTREMEKKIGFFLIRYGDWREESAETIVESGKLMGLKFVFSPIEQEESNFAFIGSLSSMISSGFRELSVNENGVKSLTLGIEPSAFEIVIPEDYKGEQLPLWRLVAQPNPDFFGLERQSDG